MEGLIQEFVRNAVKEVRAIRLAVQTGTPSVLNVGNKTAISALKKDIMDLCEECNVD